MGQKQKPSADPVTEPKKRRRVGFSDLGESLQLRFCFYCFVMNLPFLHKLLSVLAYCLSFCGADAGVEANECIKIYLGMVLF